MTHDFNGKSVLITGAGGGIGRATALAFAEAGARLTLTDVDVTAGEETAALVRARRGEAIFIKVDVTRETEVAAMVAATVAAYGRLDCAFNNAGIEIEDSRITECDESVFDRIVGVNVKGMWLCLKHELKQMDAQGGGPSFPRSEHIAMPAPSSATGSATGAGNGSTSFVESAVNQVIVNWLVKQQQMRGTPRGAHLLLQVRTQMLKTSYTRPSSLVVSGLRRSGSCAARSIGREQESCTSIPGR